MHRRSGKHAARRLWALALAAFPFLLPTGHALAADGDAASSAPSAQQLADRAYALHDAGRYVESIAAYLKVYDASGAGVALLNVATIYDRKLHERGLAAGYYRRYVNAPDAEPALVRRAMARLAALTLEEDAAAGSHVVDPAGSHVVDPAGLQTAVPIDSHATDPAGSRPADHGHAPEAATVRAAGIPALRESNPPTPLANYALALGPVFPSPRATEDPGADGWQTVGIVLTATGVVSVGTGLIFGLLAKLKNDDANAVCNGSTCPSSDGVSLARQAGSLATASTALFFSGLGLAGAGIIMVAWPKPSSGSRSVRVALAPQIGASGAGLVLAGGFRGP